MGRNTRVRYEPDRSRTETKAGFFKLMRLAAAELATDKESMRRQPQIPAELRLLNLELLESSFGSCCT